MFSGTAGRNRDPQAAQIAGSSPFGQTPGRQHSLDQRPRSRPARATAPDHCRHRSAAPRPAPSPQLRESAACRHWPRWPGAATSRCAWRGRRSPAPGWSAGSWSADHRLGRPPLGPANRRLPGRPGPDSASWPSRTCGTWSTSANTDVCTGRPGQGLPGRSADEAQGVRRRHHSDLVPRFGERAQQTARLVCSDAAADAEQDPAHDIARRLSPHRSSPVASRQAARPPLRRSRPGPGSSRR